MWELRENDNVSPQAVYDVLKKHRLLPESVVYAAGVCNSIGAGGKRFTISSDDVDICEIFVSGIEAGEAASIDLVPVAEHFRRGYEEDFRGVMKPIFDDLFLEMKVRRIGASFPASRSRTKRAFGSLGFSIEGRLTDAIKLNNEEPQDLRIVGLTRHNYLKGA